MPKKPKAKAKTRGRQKPTPKQLRLISLLPSVEAGKMSMAEAMRQAGYADSTADQQQQVLGQVRNLTPMQEAMQKAGFDEHFLAAGLVNGAKAEKKPGVPDHEIRLAYFETGAKLLDVVPAEKKETTVRTVEGLLDDAEKRAKHAQWDDSPPSK